MWREGHEYSQAMQARKRFQDAPQYMPRVLPPTNVPSPEHTMLKGDMRPSNHTVHNAMQVWGARCVPTAPETLRTTRR